MKFYLINKLKEIGVKVSSVRVPAQLYFWIIIRKRKLSDSDLRKCVRATGMVVSFFFLFNIDPD